jgi:hypothetical protein
MIPKDSRIHLPSNLNAISKTGRLIRPFWTLKLQRLDSAVGECCLDSFSYFFHLHPRRICPGRHFSHETLTYMTACLLAIYEIKPPKGPGGEALAMGQLQVTNDSIR